MLGMEICAVIDINLDARGWASQIKSFSSDLTSSDHKIDVNDHKYVLPLGFLVVSGVSGESRSLPLEESFPSRCKASWRE